MSLKGQHKLAEQRVGKGVEGKDPENDGGTVSRLVCDGLREGKGGLESDFQHGGWPGT